ncbi:MAG: cyclase family protein [Methanotrichaceae archaeon]|nr:cyclase family protein [Methanotrichaceae archaeon]
MGLVFKEVYDITILISENMPIYPGDMPFSRQKISKIVTGQPYNLSAFRFGAHIGTHLDAPTHFFDYGKSLDQYPAERFFLQTSVVSVLESERIEPQDLSELNIRRGEAVLFRTENSRRSLLRRDLFLDDFVYMSNEAAELCVQIGVSLVGIDYLSIEKYGEKSAPVHSTLLANDVLILEGIDLIDVPDGRFTLICLPLKIEDSEGAPARAILVR